MFFILGLLAILQATYLPGLLALRCANIHASGLRGAVFAFGLSLVINHFLTIALVLGHLYRPVVLYAFAGMEIIMLLAFRRDTPVGNIRYAQNFRLMLQSARPVALWKRVGVYGLLVLSAFILVYYIVIAVGRIGTVFSLWDAVVSWNRWALVWASGQIPNDTMHYPQLLPTLISTVYVVQGNADIQFFAKAACLLFPLATLSILIDWGLREKRFSLLFSTIFIGYLIKQCTNSSFYEGYADAPVAFMAFAGFYAVICAQAEEGWRNLRNYLVLGIVLCAGAGLLKQAGLYVLACLPILAWVFVLNQRSESTAKKCRLLVALFGIAVLLVLPWYAYVQWSIVHGLNSSEVGFVTNAIYKGLTPGQRLAKALIAFQDKLHWAADLMAVGVLLCLKKPQYRWLALLVAIPFFLIWACFYSYDMRNLTVATPFMGLAASLGLAQLLRGMPPITVPDSTNYAGKMAPTYRHIIATVLLLALISLGLTFSYPRLASLQIERQRVIGDPVLNSMVRTYAETHHGLNGPILTDYTILRWLPGMRPYYRELVFGDTKALRQAVRVHAGAYLLFFDTSTVPEASLQFIDAEVRAQRMQEIARAGNRLFVKIKN